jgi:acetaldehyde dehydrogenase/alcohol dehydrogenase
MLGLKHSTPAEGVEAYAQAIERLRDAVGIEPSFAAQGVPEKDFIGGLDDLAMRSYEDQCAPANPRMPMLDDMKDLMTAAFYGTSLQDVRSRRTAAVGAESYAQETAPAS